MKQDYNKIIDEMYELKIKKGKAEEEYSKRRDILIKAFDNSASNSMATDSHAATCRKTLIIAYDIEKLEKKLSKELGKQILDKEVVVINYEGLTSLLREAGIKPRQFKDLIEVRKTVNNDAIKQLFDTNQLSLEDIDGCYNAQIRKSITIS